ncbi:hypothetical protein DFH07DRAFT_343955 [Mycena maculata]|uniref:Uncharacterized protein n=1 Tax=Mycena maculata TaxID=230809 RepID=A0AAD7JMP2_9AGAR|nr:hypothetical protein DFH07DRAFT_343955 [Mycena maculata]
MRSSMILAATCNFATGLNVVLCAVHGSRLQDGTFFVTDSERSERFLQMLDAVLCTFAPLLVGWGLYQGDRAPSSVSFPLDIDSSHLAEAHWLGIRPGDVSVDVSSFKLI